MPHNARPVQWDQTREVVCRSLESRPTQVQALSTVVPVRCLNFPLRHWTVWHHARITCKDQVSYSTIDQELLFCIIRFCYQLISATTATASHCTRTWAMYAIRKYRWTGSSQNAVGEKLIACLTTLVSTQRGFYNSSLLSSAGWAKDTCSVTRTCDSLSVRTCVLLVSGSVQHRGVVHTMSMLSLTNKQQHDL